MGSEEVERSVALRAWWENCASEPDGDTLVIDALEDAIAPLDEPTARIRRLITHLELCHHRAKRHVELIVEAIGAGNTAKGPGTRPCDQRHPIERVWQNCCDVLSAWCSGYPGTVAHLDVAGTPARDLMSLVGGRTCLKVWQVQRVVDKVRSYVDPSFGYVEIVEHGEHYRAYSEFRDLTVTTVIHDSVDGEPAELALASAMDHLEACHWDFPGNLTIVLRAIGGGLFPQKPFAACRRNIKLAPLRDKMRMVSSTLRVFCAGRHTGTDVDVRVLRALGARTPVKHWLAASLDKTIRLQLGL
jgi:hypothetical protein